MKDKKYTILVVDDSEIFRNHTAKSIRDNFGYYTLLAADATEAMRLLGNHEVDMILMDIVMPGVDGIKAARIIRTKKKNAETPIIFVTSMVPTQDDLETSYKAGGIDYLVKPYKDYELIRMISLYVRFIEREKEINRVLKENEAALTHEIEERKAAEVALKESEEKFRKISSTANDAFIMINDMGMVSYWNKAAERMFGISESEAMHRNLMRLIANPEHTDRFAEIFDDFIDAGINGDGKTLEEFQAVDSSGKPLHIEVSLSSMMIGEKYYALAILRDTTEKVISQQQLVKYSSELSELNATKDKFFSIIAHDLKNPLGGIKGLLDVLTEMYDKLSEEERIECIQELSTTAKATNELLENLLTWSRSQRNMYDFVPHELDLHYTVRNCFGLLEMNAKRKNIELHNEVPQGTHIYADDNMITTVMRNLISNAIKFTPEGGSVWCSVQFKTDSAIVCVKDNGVGIPANNIEKIFRIDESMTTVGTSKERGTGLGLIICKEFITKNQGTIWCESEPGKGSEFKFSLPLERVQ